MSIARQSCVIDYMQETLLEIKEQIKQMTKEKKKHSEIAKILNVSKVTIWRILHPDKCKLGRKKWSKTVNDRKKEAKLQFGMKCAICGYSRCARALDFHHKNENEKLAKLKKVKDLRKLTKEEFDTEIAKCVLICKNCHCEIHDNLISLN